MSSIEFSEFELLLIRSGNQLGTSVLLLLVWIAASDGSIDDSEAKRLREISDTSEHGHSIKPLIGLVEKNDTTAIHLAAEIVANHFKGDKAKLFLEMAIGMAIADGYLLATENHILRFLADLLTISKRELNSIFLEITGRAIPDPSDPSAAEYWRAEQSRKQKTGSKSSSSGKDKPETPHPDKATEAYAVLIGRYLSRHAYTFQSDL
ncbi:MAG: TerB family tellurite resistance protein [Salinisphaera sp.]|nr:TerB family tellurite resistance protein [Salinisphaera sp.]